MLQVLIYSFVISYAATVVEPALSCLSNTDCARDQCCYSDPQIVSKKRQVASILPIYGTCQNYQQEGEFCSGSGCGCAPGLYCDQLLVASRAASADFIAPTNGICRAISTGGGPTCFQDSDCASGCCYYPYNSDYPINSKRLVIAQGECRPYQGYGEACYGYCGCEPGLVCNTILPPIGVVSRAVAADALIAPLPGSCRYTLASTVSDEDDK